MSAVGKKVPVIGSMSKNLHNYVTLKINGTKIKALIDSGASASVIKRGMNLVDLHQVSNTTSLPILKDVNGNDVSVYYKAPITLNLENFQCSHEFLIADIDFSIILGADFLQKYSVLLDFATYRMSIKGFQIPLEEADFKQSNTCSIISNRDHLTIPANHEFVFSRTIKG